MIETYISSERNDTNILGSKFLFLNSKGPYKGMPIRPRNFLRILKNAGQRAGLDRKK